MACLKMNHAFSLREWLKVARTLVALLTFLCFLAWKVHEAYAVLAGMETVITALFLLVYLLKLDARMRCLYWPLADFFNSVVAALFLLVVCLFAVILRTKRGTLIGGVLGLILVVLCLVDAVVLWKKISLDRARGRSAPANSD